jgi:hypothetical protein
MGGCRFVALLAVGVLVVSCTGEDGLPGDSTSVTSAPGSSTSEDSSPTTFPSEVTTRFGCESAPPGQRFFGSAVPMALIPNPVVKGTNATLEVGAVSTGTEDVDVVGWGVRLECWNGTEWVYTHLLMHGRHPDEPAAVVEQEPGVPGTMPAVGIGVPTTFTITIPYLDSGWYRLHEPVFLEGGEQVDGYLAVEVVEPPITGTRHLYHDWEFFDEIVHIEWTGDYVVDPERWWSLGPMEVTLADGQVLHFTEGANRQEWCWPVDPEVRSLDVERCWIAGAWDEDGTVAAWTAFRVRPRRVRREVVGYGFDAGVRIDEAIGDTVVIWGYPVPVAEDANVALRCCPGGEQNLEHVSDLWVGVYFDTEQQAITDIQCLCPDSHETNTDH